MTAAGPAAQATPADRADLRADRPRPSGARTPTARLATGGMPIPDTLERAGVGSPTRQRLAARRRSRPMRGSRPSPDCGRSSPG